MKRILFSDEISKRLNVSKNTLLKREFKHRIGLPPNKIGNRIAIPEPVFNEWVINKTGMGQDGKA